MSRLALVMEAALGIGAGALRSCDPPRISWAWSVRVLPELRSRVLAGPAVLTEPYSLPLLLMATKNRLATPKMLTTPRSTGESSSRPGGRVRVIPGKGTLCLRLPISAWDPHFWSGCKGPGLPGSGRRQGAPEPSVCGLGLAFLSSRPRSGRAQSPRSLRLAPTWARVPGPRGCRWLRRVPCAHG